jgi:hypothetical protein
MLRLYLAKFWEYILRIFSTAYVYVWKSSLDHRQLALCSLIDGNFMLETGNRHFLLVYALVNKTIRVANSDFCFIAENLKILPIKLL